MSALTLPRHLPSGVSYTALSKERSDALQQDLSRLHNDFALVSEDKLEPTLFVRAAITEVSSDQGSGEVRSDHAYGPDVPERIVR